MSSPEHSDKMANTETGSELSRLEEQNNPVVSAEQGREKSTLDPPDFGEAPDGGLKAWLVAAGGSAITFSCLGFANAFGTFEEYYLRHQLRNETPDNVAWIGSIAAFLQFAAGLLGGPLFDRFGAWIIRPAVILYVLLMMMLSLCEKYWHFMLVQGVLMGTCMGLIQFPAFAAVSQYFDKKRAAALGIVISGSSVGGVIIPIALSKMLNGSSLGFGWSVRIIGFLILPFMVFACLVVKARLPPRTTTFWISTAYKDLKFDLLIVAMFFMFTGMLTPLFYMPAYAVTRGMGSTLAGYLLAIINATSTFGRIIPGLLADKYGRINVFALGGIMTGITGFCMNSATSNAGMIVYSVVFGFASGTIISGATAAMSVCVKDVRDMGTFMGMGMFLGGLGSLIGPPVNGAFLDKYGGFFEVSMFSGAMCTVGGVVALLTKAITPQGIFGRI